MIHPSTGRETHSPMDYLAAAQADPELFPDNYIASIREVSEWSGLTMRTLRYWCELGILHASRPKKIKGQRYEFALEQRQRIQLVSAMRARGWWHMDIYKALNAPTPEECAAAHAEGEKGARALRESVYALASMFAAVDDVLKQEAAA